MLHHLTRVTPGRWRTKQWGNYRRQSLFNNIKKKISKWPNFPHLNSQTLKDHNIIFAKHPLRYQCLVSVSAVSSRMNSLLAHSSTPPLRSCFFFYLISAPQLRYLTVTTRQKRQRVGHSYNTGHMRVWLCGFLDTECLTSAWQTRGRALEWFPMQMAPRPLLK